MTRSLPSGFRYRFCSFPRFSCSCPDLRRSRLRSAPSTSPERASSEPKAQSGCAIVRQVPFPRGMTHPNTEVRFARPGGHIFLVSSSSIDRCPPPFRERRRFSGGDTYQPSRPHFGPRFDRPQELFPSRDRLHFGPSTSRLGSDDGSR